MNNSGRVPPRPRATVFIEISSPLCVASNSKIGAAIARSPNPSVTKTGIASSAITSRRVGCSPPTIIPATCSWADRRSVCSVTPAPASKTAPRALTSILSSARISAGPSTIFFKTPYPSPPPPQTPCMSEPTASITTPRLGITFTTAPRYSAVSSMGASASSTVSHVPCTAATRPLPGAR